MRRRRLRGDDEALGDLAVGGALGDQPGDLALARWGRRRRIRADMAEIYFGEEDERRASLEEQLLLDRERRAAHRELDRIKSMSYLYRGV